MKLKTVRIIALGCGFAGLFATSTARAVTYDYGADFSIGANPNGPWSYGHRAAPAGSFQLFDYSAAHIGQALWWRQLSGPYPAVGFNTGTAPESDGDSYFLPKTGFMIAGAVIAGPDDAVARFTVPQDGVYDMSGAWWSTGVTFGPSVDVHVLVNGVEHFGGTVVGLANAPGARADFALTGLALPGGTTVDFVMGNLNGSIAGDVAAFNVTITGTSVSTPDGSESLGLTGISLAAIYLFRRKLGAERQPVLQN